MREAIISFPMFGESFAVDPPYCITIGTFNIYYYGIIIALGFLLALWYVSKNCQRLGMKMDDVYDYVIWAVISAVIFARIYYCVTAIDANGVHTYLKNPLTFFNIRDGGLAIYGGVIGAILAIWVRSRMRRESIWPVLDIMGIGLLIGQLIGRWGNFFNRECYGYETDILCRMGLTLNGSTIYVHPAFLYESLWNLAGFLLLHFHSKKRRSYQGQYFLGYLIWYGIGRALIEGIRTDSLWLIPGVIRISQLLAGLTAALGLVFWILNARRIKAGKAPVVGRALSAETPEGDADEAAGETDGKTAEADEAAGQSAAADTGAADAPQHEENSSPAESSADQDE